MFTDPWLFKDEVSARTRLSYSTIERSIRSGLFPAPVKLSARRVAWRESVIAEWERSRATVGAAERNAA